VLLDVSLFEETADGGKGVCPWLSPLCLKPDLCGIGRAGHWGRAPGRDFSLVTLQMMYCPPNSSLKAIRAI